MNCDNVQQELNRLNNLLSGAHDEQKRWTPFVLGALVFLGVTNFISILAAAIILARFLPH